MANRHLDLMKRINEAFDQVYFHADDNQHQFDLHFDIEKMTEIAEHLEEFDNDIQTEVDEG